MPSWDGCVTGTPLASTRWGFSAHSLDAVLDAARLPLHLVDLRHTPPAILAGVTAMSGQNLLIDVDPKHAFDAVIHVRHIASAHGAADLAATEPES